MMIRICCMGCSRSATAVGERVSKGRGGTSKPVWEAHIQRSGNMPEEDLYVTNLSKANVQHRVHDSCMKTKIGIIHACTCHLPIPDRYLRDQNMLLQDMLPYTWCMNTEQNHSRRPTSGEGTSQAKRAEG